MLTESKSAHAMALKLLEGKLLNAQGLVRAKHTEWLEATKRMRKAQTELQSVKESAAERTSQLERDLEKARNRAALTINEAKLKVLDLQSRLQRHEEKLRGHILFDDTCNGTYSRFNVRPFHRLFYKATFAAITEAYAFARSLEPLSRSLVEGYASIISGSDGSGLANLPKAKNLLRLIPELQMGLKVIASQLQVVCAQAEAPLHHRSPPPLPPQASSLQTKSPQRAAPASALPSASVSASSTASSVSLFRSPPSLAPHGGSSRLFSALCASLDSWNKLVFAMIEIVQEEKELGIGPRGYRVSDGGISGMGGMGRQNGAATKAAHLRSFRRLQAWICIANDACSRYAKQEVWQSNGKGYIIEVLLESVYSNILQDSLNALMKYTLSISSFGTDRAKRASSEIWKRQTSLANAMHRLAENLVGFKEEDIKSLGIQSRLRHRSKGYLSRLALIGEKQTESAGQSSVRLAGSAERKISEKTDNTSEKTDKNQSSSETKQELERTKEDLQRLRNQVKKLEEERRQRRRSLPSPSKALRHAASPRQTLKRAATSPGPYQPQHQSLSSASDEALVWKQQFEEMEARYQEQIKSLGESLHEMGILHREAKKKSSEQQDEIDTLKEQLKVAKATNRRLTQDFALQMRKATEITGSFGSTPARHAAQELVDALMSPAELSPPGPTLTASNDGEDSKAMLNEEIW